eukprot:CAMPEP_0174699036 /NCGR_PEP_ID=MMETSP1094-20130205/4441_1 /TAXON_ID=156173 /ORGANISM="Chrysochromulina brevifilum, Strain UTEX LB 985" /LENGTH=446 /DNA_ID=CAMNT_0015896297 /DNA_START=29 /DNA_END=1369 /DNA_ORIENTATION=-
MAQIEAPTPPPATVVESAVNAVTDESAPVGESDAEAAKRKEANRKKRERAKAKKAAAAAQVDPATRWRNGKLPGARAERKNAGSDRGHGVFTVEAIPKGEVIAAAVPALSVIFDPAADLVCSFCFKQPEDIKGVSERPVSLMTAGGTFGIVLDDLSLPDTNEPVTVVTRITNDSPNLGTVRVGDRLVSVQGKAVVGGHTAAVSLLKDALAAGATAIDVMVARPVMIECQGCKKVSVCENCVGEGRLKWHNYECSVFQTLPNATTAGESATVRMLLRYKMSSEPKVGDWSVDKEPIEMLGSLQANACDVPPEQLSNLAKISGLSTKTAASLIYQVRTNACQISRGGKKVGCAVSVLMGYHNHDCSPNAAADIDGEGSVTMTALRDITEGEEVTISYIDTNLDIEERRKVLALHYNFECKCSRCMSEQRKELKQRMKEREIYMAGQRR